MKITPECIPCLLNRLLFETYLLDKNRAEAVIKDACGIVYHDFSSNISSAELATQIHKRAYEILNTSDPYESIKATAMSVGLQLQPKAEKLIENSSDKLRAAIQCAIVGNILDFGIEGSVKTPEELIDNFEKYLSEGLGHDDVDLLKNYLKKGKNILFFTDNCGEIVFDKLLCKELKKYNANLIVVVKGEPILSDATLADAEQIGMGDVSDEIITTDGYAVGLNVKEISNELQERLDSADIIISKGMANFEALSETSYKPIMYLLRTKCAPVASALSLSKNLNVAKLLK